MPPKNSNAKRTRPRAPGVKAGLELMASLGGIAVLGTQQTPYYYFPPEKRIRAGVDRCTRCVTACGPKAACNVQPLVRVGTNLWKSRQCYYCTIFPAELQGETCSLDGALYVFDGDRRRLLAVNAKGEVLNRPTDHLDLSDLPTPADSPISSVPASPIEKETTLPPKVEKPVEAKVGAEAQSETELKPTTTLSTPVHVPPPIQVVAKTTLPSAPASPIIPLAPEWTNRPAASFTPPTPTTSAARAPSNLVAQPVSVPTTPPARAAPTLEPATPADAEIVTPVAGTPAPEVQTSPSPEYQWLKNDLSLVNRKGKTSTPPTEFKPASLPVPAKGTEAANVKVERKPDSEVKRVLITDAAKTAPLFPPRNAPSVIKAAPDVAAPPVQDEDPLTQLAVSRRPLAALSALSTLLEGELVQLNAANAEVERIRTLMRAKEAERDSRAARVDRYRTAIDSALSALEEERTALTRMRATLAAALKW